MFHSIDETQEFVFNVKIDKIEMIKSLVKIEPNCEDSVGDHKNKEAIFFPNLGFFFLNCGKYILILRSNVHKNKNKEGKFFRVGIKINK